MKMDPRQARAVSETGSDILVSASAGAGKTRVLVERLVSLCVEKHIGMDEILAVTFTEAAASEMKNRVAARLQECMQNATDEMEKDWISQQLILLADADITTIDSFCLNLIRKYFSVIGLDPATAASILDESRKNALLDEAFFKALSEYDRNGHAELLALLEAYSPRSEDYDVLKQMVLSLKNLCDRSGTTVESLRSAAESLDGVQHFNDVPDLIKDGFFGRLNLLWATIEQHLDRMIRIAEDNPGEFKTIVPLRETMNLFRSTEAPLRAGDYNQFRTMFDLFGTEQKTPTAKNLPEYGAERDAMYTACSKLTAVLYSPETFVSDIKELSIFHHTLAELTILTEQYFQEAKRELACMDFTDMEVYAYEILNRNDQEVAKLYQKRLKEVMVDEFQDTSVLQNTIIETIAAPGTVFRVGDVKQSIYRFRGAKPALMRSLAQNPSISRITLDHNYRSSSKIIEFSNVLFQRLMNIEGGEDEYGTDDIVSPGVPSQTNPDDDPIRLVLLEEPEEKTGDEESFTAKERKAGWIASKMIELHEQGYHWNHFAVLVRSHAEKITIARIFEHCGIPYDIDTRQGFYNSDLCLYILSILNCIVDPEDDLSLLCVLCGELFAFEDEALAQLKLNYGSVRKGIRETRPDITEWFTVLRKDAGRGIHFLLDRIALHNGYYESLTDADKANFDFLYEKTLNCEKDRFTIYDLITLMKVGSSENSSNATSRSKDDDVVTVTTIHQSKGLQYRVVFLWSTGTNRLMDSMDTLISDPEIPFSLKHYDMPYRTGRSSLMRIAAEYRQDISDIAEYIRVLYVALTRAEQTMYIVDMAACEQPFCKTMTLSELARRKGITGYITAALQPVPGLYEVLRIPPEAFRTIPESLPPYVSALPHFTRSFVPLPSLLRPSAHEFSLLPPLSPGSSERGTRYGTMIHEVIAALPNRVWTSSDFTDTGLRPGDIEAVCSFGESALYRKALAMEIRKEFPFYTEDPVRNEAVIGVMDFVAFGKDCILLIDFKTDAQPPEKIRSLYAPQLNIYRRSLQLLKPGIPVYAYAWSFHSNCAVEIPED